MPVTEGAEEAVALTLLRPLAVFRRMHHLPGEPMLNLREEDSVVYLAYTSGRSAFSFFPSSRVLPTDFQETG